MGEFEPEGFLEFLVLFDLKFLVDGGLIEGDEVFGEVLDFVFEFGDGFLGVVEFGFEFVVLVFESVELLFLRGGELQANNLIFQELELFFTGGEGVLKFMIFLVELLVMVFE